MKSLVKMSLLVLAATAIFGQTARAAGTSSSNWTGFYAGVHLGGGFGNADTLDSPFTNGVVNFNDVIPSTLNPSINGFIGGGQVGYNLQRGCFVFGVEADLSGSTMSGSQTFSPIYFKTPTGSLGFTQGSHITSHEEINWFGTLRPRLGYTVTPVLLLYGTGGLAYGHAGYSADEAYPDGGYPASLSATKVGWTAGGGVEYAFGKCWSVKAEYMYVDLGKESTLVNSTFPDSFGNPQSGWDWTTAFHVVNIGLNFKF